MFASWLDRQLETDNETIEKKDLHGTEKIQAVHSNDTNQPIANISKRDLVKEIKTDKEKYNSLNIYRILILKSMENSFPNVFKLLLISLTIPLTSNSAERSFSQLRLIKTYLRSSMTQERLTNLAIIRINREFDVNIESLIDKFALKKKRRIQLI